MSWLDDLTTRMGDVLIAPQSFGALSPTPTDPQQRQAMITNALFSLGNTLSQAGQAGMRPMAGIGAGFQGLQQQGAQRQQQALQNALIYGKLGEQQRANQTRDMLEKMPAPAGVDPNMWKAMLATDPGAAFKMMFQAQQDQRMADAYAPTGGAPSGGGSPASPIGGRFNIGNLRAASGGFQTFGTPEEAITAAVRNVQAYPGRFNQGQPMTLLQVGERWAPKGDGANDPVAWANNVAKIGGLPVDKPLDFNNPDVAQRFARGVHGAEFGQQALYGDPEVYKRGATAALMPTRTAEVTQQNPVQPAQYTPGATQQPAPAPAQAQQPDYQNDPALMMLARSRAAAYQARDWNRVQALDGQIATRMGQISDAANKTRGEGREFSEEDNLRKEFTAQVKPFQEYRGHYQRILAANEKPSAAGDIAMVYGFMKMLDPTSVVREGEFATAATAGGIDERIRVIYNKLINGERLTEDLRKDFMDRASRIFDKSFGEYEQIRKTFQGLATAYGRNPDRVAPDFTAGIKRPVISDDVNPTSEKPPAEAKPKQPFQFDRRQIDEEMRRRGLTK